MEKKALVLSGGGARGGYQIGVWEALKELNYVPNIITGTSVGALNGGLFTLGEDELARNIWENMSMDTVFEKKEDRDINAIKTPADFVLHIYEAGGTDPKPLKHLVNKLVDDKKFRESNIEFGVVVTGTKPIRKVEKFVDEMEEGKVADYILASSACFPIMQMYQINGVNYLDGGYSDNIPFEMALKRGATELVIVDMPSMFKLKKVDDINAKIHYITPKHDLGNFMIFNKESANKNILLGYLDTLKAFNKLEGTYYAFSDGSNVDAYKYNKQIKEVYKRIFTNLPTIGKIERLATDKLIKYMKKYNEETVYENTSDVLNTLEIAAQSYGIDYTKIYSFDELKNMVIEKYKDSTKTEEYKQILSLSKIMEKINSMDEVRKLIKQHDNKNIIAYIVYLLTLPEINQTQKNQILVMAMIMPNYVYTAIFIATICK